ncbi:molybdopterin-guanine dinucleotide biosynthesis protein B [Paenisporosarcina antarctica]|uniref:Molybdopterin-guanine dinucleotide biosynthesis protein B n=1 Tax=Paenisporosarcina antarctica TaxID=417367 RepID=A0A4P6ZXR6_9BACL|nr:molybdopterin-guanine dinucleotide biosynthesis protein B [Paenisporosarcina antarctica]QBP41074.1 molybdopterin-guanine dinucleotide biosynthesis protein B [Paenisporosarcina antarctica]
MVTVKVLQVVGFKNSGKTTLITGFLDLAQNNGKTISTIKHHGHGGALELPPVETDSMQFFNHGAQSSLAYGEGVVQIHMQNNTGNLDELIELSCQSKPDIVLIEGFKKAAFDKVVLVRSQQDWETLQDLDNIVLVIVHECLELKGFNTLERSRLDDIYKWFAKWMVGETNESI